MALFLYLICLVIIGVIGYFTYYKCFSPPSSQPTLSTLTSVVTSTDRSFIDRMKTEDRQATLYQSSSMLHYNNDDMVQQEFPFPAKIMDYIFKNVSATQLLKLYHTCKFFYDKFKLNIIEDFEFCNVPQTEIFTSERIFGNSLAIHHSSPAISNLRNLWISKSFIFCDHFGYHRELDLEMFSCLTYNKLYINGPYPLREYEFLVKPPTLRFIIVDGKIYRSTKTDCLSIEEIIELVPHVSAIDLTLEMADNPPPLDMIKLISMERQTKLTSFHLKNVTQIPEPLQVVEFLKKHGTLDIDYYFGFTNNNADDIKAFYKTIDTELQAWKLSHAIPPTISSFIDLSGKTAVITGASEGIGKATVILFRQLGASVIAVARNHFKLKTLIEECQNISTAGFLHTVPLDSIEGGEDNKIFKRINYKFGTKFDVLVNIFDISGCYCIPDIPALEYKDSHDWYFLKGHYDLIKRATPYLKEAKGCIINVSESDESDTLSNSTEDAEEADMIPELKQFIKNVENELASSGGRINIVNPGAYSTSLPRPNGINDTDYKKFVQKSKKTQEQQAAKAIAFLASDAAKLIVGSTFPQL